MVFTWEKREFEYYPNRDTVWVTANLFRLASVKALFTLDLLCCIKKYPTLICYGLTPPKS